MFNKIALDTKSIAHYTLVLITLLFMSSCTKTGGDSYSGGGSSIPIGQGDLDRTRKPGDYYTRLNAAKNQHLPKGKPYTVRGQSYVPYTSSNGFEEIGVASWYGPGFHGKLTANGEKYNQNGVTAAHKLLPFGTMLRVTNLDNGMSTIVRVNDRGPFLHGRIIDLSKGAASKINMLDSGTAKVHLAVAGAPNSLGSSGGSGGSSYGVPVPSVSGGAVLGAGAAGVGVGSTMSNLFSSGGTFNNPDNPGGLGLERGQVNRFGQPVGASLTSRGAQGSYGAAVPSGNGGTNFVSSDPNEFGDDPSYYMESGQAPVSGYNSDNNFNNPAVNTAPLPYSDQAPAPYQAPYQNQMPINSFANTNIPVPVPVHIPSNVPSADSADVSGIAYSQNSPSSFNANVNPYGGAPLAESPNGEYFIQLGLFKDKANADAFLDSLKSGSIPAKVFTDKGLYFVQAGPYSNKDEVFQVRSRLRTHFPQSYIVIR